MINKSGIEILYWLINNNHIKLDGIAPAYGLNGRYLNAAIALEKECLIRIMRSPKDDSAKNYDAPSEMDYAVLSRDEKAFLQMGWIRIFRT